MLDAEGRITNWNAGAQAIKGYREDEVVGRHFSLFYTPEDRAAGMPARALKTALRDGKFEGEALRMRKNGDRFWAHVMIDRIDDDNGQLAGFAKVTRDITEKRLAEQQIQKSREALVQAQKMEAIGRLTGGVAHDFNNLLTVIRASADFLRRPNLSDEKRDRYVKAIAETAERATVLTSQLLAFSRRQTLQPEVFEVNQRLSNLVQTMSTTVGSSIDLQLALDGEEQLVEVDLSQFETAMLNMVINARDAMPGGGSITIRSWPALGVPSVRGHSAVAGDFVAVDVIDTGTGMAAETMAQIFEPFFTTKPVDKGTGLGLSQVYGFAKQSRGEVSVKSSLGAGSTFTLFLPRTNQALRPPVEAVDRGGAENVQLRILLVEDNEGVGRFAASLLEELGQTVTWVGDAGAALEVLHARADSIDLVFTDVVMPGESGIELAHQIRAAWPSLQVVLTSGYSHVLAESGTYGYPLLKKPYSVDGLLGILQRS
ncbi:PAS domain-containing sensor histidine kinase [soil metagenome]